MQVFNRSYASFREHAFHALEGMEVKRSRSPLASLAEGMSFLRRS